MVNKKGCIINDATFLFTDIIQSGCIKNFFQNLK